MPQATVVFVHKIQIIVNNGVGPTECIWKLKFSNLLNHLDETRLSYSPRHGIHLSQTINRG